MKHFLFTTVLVTTSKLAFAFQTPIVVPGYTLECAMKSEIGTDEEESTDTQVLLVPDSTITSNKSDMPSLILRFEMDQYIATVKINEFFSGIQLWDDQRNRLSEMLLPSGLSAPAFIDGNFPMGLAYYSAPNGKSYVVSCRYK